MNGQIKTNHLEFSFLSLFPEDKINVIGKGIVQTSRCWAFFVKK